jgi:hypothetical protein
MRFDSAMNSPAYPKEAFNLLRLAIEKLETLKQPASCDASLRPIVDVIDRLIDVVERTDPGSLPDAPLAHVRIARLAICSDNAVDHARRELKNQVELWAAYWLGQPARY